LIPEAASSHPAVTERIYITTVDHTSPIMKPISVLAAAISLGVATTGNIEAQPTYEVYAIRYATLPQFSVSGLVAGAEPGRRLDIAMMIVLLKGSNGSGGRGIQTARRSHGPMEAG
jgi:hypothetical protein